MNNKIDKEKIPQWAISTNNTMLMFAASAMIIASALEPFFKPDPVEQAVKYATIMNEINKNSKQPLTIQKCDNKDLEIKLDTLNEVLLEVKQLSHPKFTKK